MKKLLAIMMSLAMVFAMCACSKTEEPAEEPSAGMVNPVHECTYEELVQTTGLDIKAPADAEDVVYSYIEADGIETIAQVQFEYKDMDFCYRAQSTGATSIMSDVADDGFVEAEDLVKSLADGINVGEVLSGMQNNWSASAAVDVFPAGDNEAGREGICAWNEGEAGFISWLDVVPGILYSLSIDDDCTQDALMNTANEIFVPMQGEA